jgi:glycosylphosphatidylinositol transamidase (GPIT) subunit GPI8
MKQNKIDDALFDCYRELFANSTPQGDFDKLVESATINDRGQKEIPFDDYEIAEEAFERIINETLKKHKVPKSLHKSFNIAIYLGCSPRFIRKDAK